MSPTYSPLVQNIIYMHINIENTKIGKNVNSCTFGKIYIEASHSIFVTIL